MTQLPANSTAFERALSEAMDEVAIIGPAIDSLKGVKYARPLNITVGPWLIQEYGLGGISQFFDTVEDVIDQGRPWQKIRGTKAAIEMALEWIDYDTITINDRVINRRRWHLYQIDMGELPFPNEDARLANAEYLADLSDPARSFFWRGYFGYDVRGHVWGRSRYGRSIWGDSSGVRINGGKTKWSHGRTHIVNVTLSEDLKNALGINYADEDDIGWADNLSWEADGVSWVGVHSAAILQAWLIINKDAFLAMYGISGELLGVLRILRPGVTEEVTGEISIRFDARTGFGDGAGLQVASLALAFDVDVSGTVKPFKRWLLPDVVNLDAAFDADPVADSFLMGKTIREFFDIVMAIGPVNEVIAAPDPPPEGFLYILDESDGYLMDEDTDYLTTSEG